VEKESSLKSDVRQLLKPAWRLLNDLLPAKMHVELDHLRSHGKLPNLKNPRTFSEKTAWRKLYDRDPRMPPLIDKIVAKELMATRFGPEFIIPTLAVYESENDVDFSVLPYPCVVKTNHGSGTNVFLSRRPEDEGSVKRQLGIHLRHRHESDSEEWAYSRITPRLLVEPFLEGGAHGLVDYKFHTFGGHVFAIQVDVDRYTDHRRSFYDASWTEMPVELLYPKASYAIDPPVELQTMLRYSEQIGEGFSYVRVDLYEAEDKVKFGEATFYHGAGLERFNPREFDEVFGAQWVIGAG
jgi:hypothetical protein